MHDLKRDGGAYLSDYDDEIRQAKECFRCSADFERKIAKAKCERDEWRSRCESLESTWLSAQVEAAAMREALELAEAWAKNDCASCESPFKEDDTCQFPNLCTTRPTLAIIQKALSSDAGKDLLERNRQAESIIKRFAEFDHMLIRKAVCKECGESPCKGDDKVLCVYKDLIAAIDAYLKGGEPRG